MRARLARTTGGFTESRTVATVDGAGGGTFVRGEAAIHAFFTRLRITGFGPEKRKFSW